MACLDTGAQVSILSWSFYNDLQTKPKLLSSVQLRMAGNQITEGRLANVTICIGGSAYDGSVFVAPVNEPFTIGLDFMHRFGARLDFTRGVFSIGNYTQDIKLVKHNGQEFNVSQVWLNEPVIISPKSGINVPANTHLAHGADFAISPTYVHPALIMPNILVHGSPIVWVPLMNPTDRPILLGKRFSLGIAIEVDQVIDPDDSREVYPMISRHLPTGFFRGVELTGSTTQNDLQIPDHLLDLFTRSCRNLTLEQQFQVKKLLVEYQSTFSKGATDLGCFKEIQHKIELYSHARPVRQPLRRVPLGLKGRRRPISRPFLKPV